jgi:hypothetical protein
MLVVTELHYHRNGVAGDGYYAGRAHWTPDDERFDVMFAAFLYEYPAERGAERADGKIAIMGNNDVGTSFRYEDFERGLVKFITSRGGQAMAFPHTIVQHA